MGMTRNKVTNMTKTSRNTCRAWLVSALMMVVFSMPSKAQKFSVSVNAGDLVWFGTGDLAVSAALGQHLTLDAEARYNPWKFRTASADTQFQDNRREISAGVAWWPWHVYSGWYVSSRVQLQEYNRGGIWNRRSEEGVALGLTFGGGYSYMITEWLNVSFGLEGWAGAKDYTKYACPKCGRIIGEGRKGFIAPNDVKVSFSFLF